jgi:hypothetical protein
VNTGHSFRETPIPQRQPQPQPQPAPAQAPTKQEITVEYIKQQLASNDRWAQRAVVVIYEKQTASEKTSLQTREANGVGFNMMDAEILSSFAEKLKKGWSMSPKQMAIIHKKMPKYANQLLRIVKGEA